MQIVWDMFAQSLPFLGFYPNLFTEVILESSTENSPSTVPKLNNDD
jgi:hypothetical protein